MKRFPDIRQHDAMECGVACLTAVLRHCGRFVSMAEVERLCSASSEGVSLLGLKRAAEKSGLDGMMLRMSIDALLDSPLPAIVHWNQNHFVTLYHKSRDGRRLFVADPAKGLVKYTRDEFCQHWISMASGCEGKGIALLLQPGENFVASRRKSHSTRRSLRFLLGYMKRYRSFFIQIFIGLLLGCVFQLIMPFLTQAIVDEGIAQKNIGFIWLVLLGEMMIVAGRTATDFIRRWLLLHISMRVNISLVSDFLVKLLKLPMSFFDTKQMGDLLQRMADHDRVQSFLTGQVLNTVFSLVSFIVFGSVLAVYDWLIFAVFIAGSAIYGAWLMMFLRRRKLLDYELFEHQSQNQNKTYQFISSLHEIKLQGCRNRRRWEWEDVQADLFGVQMKTLKLQQSQEAGSVFINETKNILITVLAATAVVHGEITLGAMLAVQYIAGQLSSPVQQLLSLIYSIQDVMISLDRINDIHLREQESETGLSSFEGSGEGISLRNVEFSYDINAPVPVVSDVTFSVDKGRITAIVGASGSGKTTLIKLMLGFYPVLKVAVEIGGRLITDYNPVWWREQCGVVMQDGVIFSESIARNIAVDDGPCDSARLEEAARIACIHDFIMGLPLKYDTKIGNEGVGLSQGQKQRILIARAVYKQPDYIFMDEATNALDAENERAIVENLDKFYRGRTVVVVAHRLSTVKNADKIVVLDKGAVVEQGTHAQLIALKGKYFNLVKNQLELGL